MSRESPFRIPMVLSMLALATFVACGGGTVTDAPGPGPVQPVDTTKPPVTVQRGRLTVRVAIDSADASLASTAGITASGLAVRLVRPLSSDPPRTATVNAAGIAQFDSLLDASYQLSIDRTLSDVERSRLAEADRDVGILAAGTTVRFSPPTQDVQLSLVASRRGSLVISEMYGYLGASGGVPYNWGSYLEVYNNSDTTAYLDGVMIGFTWGGMHTGDLTRPCATFNVASRLDSTSLWLPVIEAFPGRGRDYPIHSGEAKVIALDATNHASLAPNQFDLSAAPFEQHGSEADVDNPFVPDLAIVRSNAGYGPLGRGYPIRWGQSYAILAARAIVPDVPSYIEGFTSGPGYPAYRIDRQYVLDVFSVDPAPALQVSTHCQPFISPIFDRDLAQIGDYYTPQAVARKSLGRRSNGVEILQRTRTSSRDFEYREPLLRSLRK